MLPLRAALLGADRPSLDLNFAATRQLDPRITFSRASSATFIGPTGLVETAATGVPRFTHDPVTGQSLGLLVEEARTNLFLRSEQFNDAAWVKAGGTVTANATTAPDGTLTADTFVEGSGGTFKTIDQTISLPTTVTFSIYAKAAGRSWCSMQITTGAVFSYFNLSGAGSLGATSGLTARSITAVGNGWYLLTVTASTGGGTGVARVLIASADNTASYSGDGVSGIHLWGAQVEAGSFATSYIPTTGASALRAADVATITGTNFASWYRQDEGTFVVDYIATPRSLDRRLFSIGPGVASIDLVQQSAGSLSIDQTTVGSLVSTANTTLSGVLARAGGVFRPGGYAVCLNGGQVTADVDSNAITATSITLGAYVGGSAYMNAPISRIRYWRRRLPDAQLQRLTAL